MLAPLAFGFPGGVELFVILLVSLLLFSPLVALVYLVLFRREVESADEERLADLETEVAELRERLDERGGSGDPGPGRDRSGDDGTAGASARDDATGGGTADAESAGDGGTTDAGTTGDGEDRN